jgi:hypothetical protein
MTEANISQVPTQNVAGDYDALWARIGDLEKQLADANVQMHKVRKTEAQTAKQPFGYVVELRRDQPWPGIRWRRSRIIVSKEEAEQCAGEWRKDVEGSSFFKGSHTNIIPLFAGFASDIAFVARETAELLRAGESEPSLSTEVLLSRLPEAIAQACETYRKPAEAPSRLSIRRASRRS